MQPIDYNQMQKLLQQGEIIAIPTETVYGLAVNALDNKAIQKLFSIKGRPTNKPINIQIGEAQNINKYAYIDHPREQQIVNYCMPGPITLILRKKGNISDMLTAQKQYVGIRIPSHPDTLQLLQQIDFPLAVPSANISDQPPAQTAQEAKEIFGDKIVYYMPNNYPIGKQASTVVQIIDDELIIHRPGPISYEQLKNIIKKGV